MTRSGNQAGHSDEELYLMDVYKRSEPSPLRILGLALHKDHHLAACISKHPKCEFVRTRWRSKKATND